MKSNYARSSSGFTLMEVLVALAVLSIGLLGMAGMQLFSLKSSHDAYLRTQATVFAHELIDKMRANRVSAINGNYDTTLAALGAGTNCQSNTCSTVQLASYDLAQWKCALGAYENDPACTNIFNLTSILPGGDGTVTRDPLVPNRLTVTVQWNVRGNATPENVMVVAEL